jgi:hypothetical protein
MQNLSKCLKRRRERMRSMENRAVRLKPLSLNFENSEDVTIAKSD